METDATPLNPAQLGEFYRTGFAAMNQGFCLLERIAAAPGEAPDFRYLVVNPAFEQHSGLRQVVGKTIRQVVSQTEESIIVQYDRVALTGEPVQLEAYVTALDLWMEAYAFRVSEHPARIAVLFTNSTARKQAEEAQRLGEERMRELLQNLPDYAIFRLDAQGFITEWTEGAQRVKGYTPEEAIGQHLALFYTPEERAVGEPDNELRQAARMGRAERESVRIRKGGERFWVNEIATAIYDPTGQLVGFTKISRDITDRKHAEQRQAFLLQLSDTLRPLDEAAAIQGATAKLLQAHFNAGWSYYCEFDQTATHITVLQDATREGLSSLAGTHPFSDMPEFLALYQANQVVLVENFQASPLLSQRAKDLYRPIGIQSFLGVPVLKEGRLIAALILADSVPKVWSKLAIDLTAESAERTWAAVVRARAEAAQVQSERFIKGMITSLPSVVYIFDLQKRRNVFLSPQVEPIFGYTVEQMQTSDSELLPTFFHPDDLSRLGAYFQTISTSQTESIFSIECRMKHRQRGWIWVQCRDLVYERDAAGRPVQLLGTAEDITERKEAELALRESEKHFRLTIEAARMGTWDWNLLTNEVVWNDEHFRLFGMEPRPNPIGPEVYIDHVHPDERERVSKLLHEAIAKRGVFDAEFCALLDDGRQRWMSGYGRVVEEADGKATRMSGVMFDIDTRKRAEDALRVADRRKDEFLALLAHELRNPLATLSNTLLVLELTGGQDEALTLPAATTLMNREVAHLVRLVDDLLDVSRISRGLVSLALERLDVVALVRDALEAAKTQYQRSGRALTVTLPGTPLYLAGDAARLKQVVSNLLSNALKFTQDGDQVWLTLERADGQAVLRVQDNGIGIPGPELQRIFEMFVQVDNSLGRSQSGLGLGLTLVHELVHLHGGRVEARSAGAGQGSEFLVYLPLEPVETDMVPPTPTNPSSSGSKRRVLVVDDNQDAATTLAMLLKLLGNEVYTRYNGQAGVEAAQSLHPQVILLDISMPGMDGYQTCRLIREQPWGKAMTLIALSGYGQAEDKRRSQEAGFDTHLVKPVDIVALQQLLATLPAVS